MVTKTVIRTNEGSLKETDEALHALTHSLDSTTGLPVANKSTDGAEHVTDIGIPSQRHNRVKTIITATWPANDTFSVSWTAAENVRRYRIMVTGGADGDFVKVCEDAVNAVQAAAWLTTATDSSTADVDHFRVATSTPDANGSFIPLWSDWQELSKDAADIPLSRLDFLATAAGPFTVFVEAE
jgi:hypothetical protein